MRVFGPLLAAAIASGLLACPAPAADRPRDQDRAYRATVNGEALPYPQIKERIMPFMGDAVPLGPEINGGGRYFVKFMRGGRLIRVEVDPATGRILGRSR